MGEQGRARAAGYRGCTVRPHLVRAARALPSAVKFCRSTADESNIRGPRTRGGSNANRNCKLVSLARRSHTVADGTAGSPHSKRGTSASERVSSKRERQTLRHRVLLQSQMGPRRGIHRPLQEESLSRLEKGNRAGPHSQSLRAGAALSRHRRRPLGFPHHHRLQERASRQRQFRLRAAAEAAFPRSRLLQKRRTPPLPTPPPPPALPPPDLH